MTYKHLSRSPLLRYVTFTDDQKYSITNPPLRNVTWIDAGASFQLFLGGPKIFLFFSATGLLKNWKKQHFICSNLTLFIAPFFLSFLSLFSFLSFFFSFFLFPWGGRRPPSPPQMTPLNRWPTNTFDEYSFQPCTHTDSANIRMLFS